MLVLKLNCLQTQHSHRRQLMHSHTSSPKQYSHTIRASPPLHPIQSDTDALLSQSAQLLHTRLVTKNVQNDRPAAVAAYCNNTKIMYLFMQSGHFFQRYILRYLYLYKNRQENIHFRSVLKILSQNKITFRFLIIMRYSLISADHCALLCWYKTLQK